MRVAEFDGARRQVLLRLGFAPEKRVFLLNGYPAVHLEGKVRYVHRLVAERLLKLSLARRLFVHHCNEDRTDFRPQNLQVCSHGEHNGLHRRFGADNHFFGRQHSPELRQHLSHLGRQRPPKPLSLSARQTIARQSRLRPRDAAGRFLPGASQ